MTLTKNAGQNGRLSPKFYERTFHEKIAYHVKNFKSLSSTVLPVYSREVLGEKISKF